MNLKVSNLTIEQLEKMINNIVEEKIDNLVEYYESLTSEKFLKSLTKARREHKEGKYKSIGDIKSEIQGSHHRKRRKGLKKT